MIVHPTNKELAAQKTYPTVEQAYSEAGLGTVAPLEKSDAQWIARKCHKTHFSAPQQCQSDVRSNTDVLYDGSVQARAILGPTFEGDITEEGAGVRRHALDYLKGRDVPLMGMWTKEIMDEDETVIEADLTELEKTAIQNMVMDRSAVVTEEEPKLVQIAPLTFPDKPCAPVQDAVFDGEDNVPPTTA